MEDFLQNIDISEGEHKGNAVIWLKFPYNEVLQNRLKSMGAKFSYSQKSWYVMDHPNFRKLFNLSPPPPVGKAVMSKISDVNKKELSRMLDTLELKAYSPNTIRTYSLEFSQLLYLIKDFPVYELSPERLRSYILFCIRKLKMSESQVHSRLNAIKFYFEQVLNREAFMMEIPRPKKVQSLPKVLSTKEIKKLFSVVENPKHKVMLQLCYGMGLRVSEIVALKISHIDSHRMQVLIACAKGKKDRYVRLPFVVLDDLEDYYKEYQPKEYVFEGHYGRQYSVRSVQSVFKQAMEKAKINKTVGVHALRQSYATHLLEHGADMALIHKLLVNKKVKSSSDSMEE